MIKKEQFPVQGMHCVSCVLTIERALKQVPGVKTASVNLISEKAMVEFEDTVNPEKLKEAVAQTGYKLIIEKDGVSAEGVHGRHKMTEKKTEDVHDHHKLLKEAEIKSLWRKFIVGAILSVFIVFLSFPDYFGVGSELLPTSWRFLILFFLTIPVEFWVGYQFWRGAWYGLK